MKSSLIHILIIIVFSEFIYSQEIELLNVDNTGFPVVSGFFNNKGISGEYIKNSNINDYKISENGINRKILNITCNDKQSEFALSSVLVFDLSLSMRAGLNESRLDISKKAGKYWLSLQNGFDFETSLISFSTDCKLLSNFTTDISALSNKIDEMQVEEFTHYIPAFLDDKNGALNIANNGKYRRIIIFLTDGFPTDNPDFSEIIKKANKNNISIYPILIAMNVSDDMLMLSKSTLGKYYENIYDEEQLKEAYEDILNYEKHKDSSFCKIEWESNYFCNDIDSTLYKIEYIPFNTSSQLVSYVEDANKYLITCSPSSISLPNDNNLISTLDTSFTIFAQNRDLDIQKIYCDISGITFSPDKFFLQKGATRTINIKYNPKDYYPINSKIFIAYNDCIKSIDLIIDSLTCVVIVEDDSAYIGEKKNLKIKIFDSSKIPQNYKFKISYNKTLLTITDPLADLSFNDTNEICTFSGYWNGIDTILTELPYIAGHGNAKSTELQMIDFQWMELPHKTVAINGYFYLLGIGKNKLIEPNILELNLPQLVDKSHTSLVYKSMSGEATLKLYDIIGRVIKNVILPKSDIFSEVFFPLKELSIGTYLIILQSGEYLISKKIMIL